MESKNNNKRMLRGHRPPVVTLLITLIATALAGPVHAAVRGAPDPVLNAASMIPADPAKRLYIVELRQPPALGNPEIAGRSSVRSGFLAGTVADNRFDPNASVTRRYVQRLEAQQQAVLDSLGLADQQVHSYRYAFNGFAVGLTRAQAAQLRLHKQVRDVSLDSRRAVSTRDSGTFLGLNDGNSGLRANLGLRGNDVIIGVIDSGITPQHPSFADRAATREKPRICRSEWAENSLLGLWLCRRFNRPGKVMYGPVPERWNGACETGENFTRDDCNRKLIGARFYNAGFEFEAGVTVDDNEFLSPADADGHGTHIASIAAGNEVEADIFGRRIGKISGMAPRARVAVYKACWLEPGGFRATCSVADLQAAIEDAIADGVDIINYSVGSLDDSLTDRDDISLLRAAEHGILSVVATGNDGPTTATLQSPGTTPWVLSVAASTRAGTRVAEALRVNAPAAVATDYEVREAAFTPRLSNVGPVIEELVLVDDGDVLTPENEQGTRQDGCSAFQNATDVENKIAFIQRGGCDFELKIENAQAAGAIAVVVYSNDNPLQYMSGNSAGITIPAVMIGQADGLLLRDRLAADETVEVRLDKDIFINLVETGNIMGTFSGRGPSLADPDFLKPDVTAPGVRILGAQTPDVANSYRGELYQYLSGTSQSAPHVAGIAALIKEQHPDWTPAEIKSALMTTARQNIDKEIGGERADPFDMGAGHIVPNRSISPGLVFPTEIAEYDTYLCTVFLQRVRGNQCAALVASNGLLDAADVNLPSIAITELVTSREVTRRVRNVGTDSTYQVEIDAPAGVDVSVSPTTLSMGNAEEEYTVTFTADGASLNEWLFGSISWVSDNHTVYTPFAVQPTSIIATEYIESDLASSSVDITVDFGYTGSYRAEAVGLQLPCVLPDNNMSDEGCSNSQPEVVSGLGRDYRFLDTPTADIARFTIERDPADVLQQDRDFYVRIALFDQLTDGDDDLDMYVYDCVDKLPEGNPDGVCESTELIHIGQNDGSSEELFEEFAVREPGSYIVDVHAYNVDGSNDDDGAEAQFCLLTWSLGPDSDAGNLNFVNAPTAATYGTSSTFQAAWTDLDDGLWLGGVQHFQDNTDVGFTLVDINANGLPDQTPGNFACP